MKINLPAQAARALALLNGQGFCAYVVGGCVRDSLMGLEPSDWDIATDAAPDEVKRVFSSCRVIETGLRHGTLTVLLDGALLEITTFRVEGAYSDHRRPDSVAFTRELKADLSRRDFTINAMAYHPTEGLKDFFGGMDDLSARRIKCVGDAAERFLEDALRILRAARFAAVLGFSIEERTGEAMRLKAPLLRHVSAERVADELGKTLLGQNIADVLIRQSAVFFQVLPELAAADGFLQHTPYHHLDVWRHTVKAVESAPPDRVLRLAMLLHDAGKPETFSMGEEGIGHFYGHAQISAQIAENALRRLRFDNATREQVVYLIAHHCDRIAPVPALIKRFLNRMGEERLSQLIEVQRADCSARSPAFFARQMEELNAVASLLRTILAERQAFCLKDLAVNGDDLIRLGFAPGKELGEALRQLLQAVIEGQVLNEHGALLLAAQGLLKQGNNNQQ